MKTQGTGRMAMNRLMRTVLGPSLLLIFIAACTETKYVKFSEVDEANSIPHLRTVAVEIDREYYRNYPDCVVVLPPHASQGAERFSKLVEASLALRLTRKISQVISGAERDLAARRMSVDLVSPVDQDALMDGLGCDAFVTMEVIGPGQSYLVVWSEVRIGIEVRMIRAGDRRLLWRARHIAGRSEGGLPVSPVSFVMDAFSSTRFSADQEIVDSVVDDAVRRLVASLPNFKSFR